MDANDLLLIGFGVLLILLLRQWYVRGQQMERRTMEIVNMQREFRQIQTSLQATEQRLQSLADVAFDALLIVDARHRVVAMNEAARELFRVEAEAVGRTLMAVTRNHELDDLCEKVFRNEELLLNPISIDGRTFRVRAARSEGGEEPVATVALQDITELLRLSRARRDMVANFSHDLRTPISSIRLLVESLMLNFGRNAERDLKLLGKIAGETDSLQHMTQELIDLSMIESGMAIMRMVRVKLSDILNNALSIMDTQIEQKRIEVSNTVSAELAVLADPDQIRRVMANLIHNAVKFTPAGGQIRFTAELEASMVRFCVRDTGPGIPPHERTRIFERFYQVDTARTPGTDKNGSGTGLGLAIAKHIVEAHGGKIWAEANIPSGACICFTLPLDEGKS